MMRMMMTLRLKMIKVMTADTKRGERDDDCKEDEREIVNVSQGHCSLAVLDL